MMQCKDVEVVIEQEGLAPLPEAARAHVAGCSHCREFVSDLATIISAVQEFPAEVEPPAHVWSSIRTQLEREGIIKELVTAPAAERSSWWSGFSALTALRSYSQLTALRSYSQLTALRSFFQLFRSRGLATATVGLLIIAGGILQLQQPAAPPTPQPPQPTLFAETAKLLNEQETGLRSIQLASASLVDDSLRQNLRQVDDFIADCERRVREAPQDDLAREYLSNAYQQKADLLSAMMDRGGSVN